nr:replication protein A 70 kDa DNA-binding subunit D-like [Ipomoea batatas]
MFILARDISPMNTRSAIRLRVVRAYDIPERKASSILKSKELVFHDQEVSLNKQLHFLGYFCYCLNIDQTPMKSILSQSSFNPTSSYSISHEPEMQLCTISQIYQLNEYGDFWVAARVVFIDSCKEWFYASCRTKGCNRKLSDKEGTMYCLTCNKTWAEGVLRYRVKIRVADLNGNAPFLLWDRECCELLGMSAYDLDAKQNKDKNGVPKELQSLVGLNLIFRIAVRKEQFHNMLNAFPVMRILNDNDLIEEYAPELMHGRDKDLSSKLELELTEEDLCDDGDFDDVNEAESPLQVVPNRHDKDLADNATVKRALIDAFSSTQSSKKTKEHAVKLEKLKEL